MKPAHSVLMIGLLLSLVFSPVAGAQDVGAALPSCVVSTTQLCLNDGFAVSTVWGDALAADATAVAINDDVGYLWFDDPRYPELAVQLLDGCAVNSQYWVLAAGLSDRRYDLNISQAKLGMSRTYSNFAGTFSTLADTSAFGCGAGPIRGEAEADHSPVPTGPAVPVDTLVDGRFSVEVEWEASGGATGFGNPVDLTDYASYFWFFSVANPEIFVKIVDNSKSTGFFSVVIGGTTTVGYDVTITDACRAPTQIYTNPVNNTGQFSDPTAFAADACEIFANGFESGGLGSWGP